MARHPHRGDASSWLTPALGSWVIGSAAASFAGSVVGFGLAWTAAGLGAEKAAVVMMVWSAPLVLFSLMGGVLGDRWGHRRMLIITNLGQLGAVAIGGPIVLSLPDSTVALAGFAATLGTVQALRTPSAGSAVRLFVADEQLTLALAATTTLTQILTLTAPAVSGLLVSLWGFGSCLVVLAAALVGSSVVFFTVRPPLCPEPAPPESPWRQLRAGVALVARREVAQLLASLGLVAGAMLPLLSVMVPLVAHERTWTAAEAGLLASAWTVGSILVGLVVSGRRTGGSSRAPLLVGPALAALGTLVLAMTPWSWLGIAGMLIVGAGVRTYTSAAAPRLLLLASRELTARLQSILLLVQQASVLIMVGGFGLVTEHLGAAGALGLAGTLTVAGSLLAYWRTPVGRLS